MEQTFSIEKLDSGLILTEGDKRSAIGAPKEAAQKVIDAFTDLIKGIYNAGVSTLTIKVNVDQTP